MHSGHFIKKCSNCDTVISQCKCMSEKETIYEICDSCAAWAVQEEQCEQGTIHHAQLLIDKKHGLSPLGKIKPDNDISSEMECPKCKGILKYTISKLNGHTSGKCETNKCLGWIQ